MHTPRKIRAALRHGDDQPLVESQMRMSPMESADGSGVIPPDAAADTAPTHPETPKMGTGRAETINVGNITLTQAELAKEAGVPISTIKYYVEIGLIPFSQTAERSWRRFPAESVAIVRQIKDALRTMRVADLVAEVDALRG